MKLTIGLFGTCGGSQWRKPFAERYEKEGISFFDPQVPNWTAECAVMEAEHLAEDAIILFPVTGETTGIGSLSEVGFSILNAIRLDNQRDFVIMIEPALSDKLVNELPPNHVKESIRARALVNQHLKKMRLSNLYVVSSLEEMLEVSVQLHKAAAIRIPLQRLNPHAEK
jgi:quinolinate synthase